MRDGEDPLWYDKVEAGDEPGPILHAMAKLFAVTRGGFLFLNRIYWMPDRLWLAGSRLARRLARISLR